MISQLNQSDIHKALLAHVKRGDPNDKGLPTVVANEEENREFRLYGTFDESNFALTFNLKEEVCPYILKGRLNASSRTQTEVEYRVQRMRFPKLLFLLIFISVHAFTALMLLEEMIFAISAFVFYVIFWIVYVINYRNNRAKLRELEEYFKTLLRVRAW